MQRRAAAIYFVFFLVVGAAAWAYIGVAEDTQRPQISVSGTEFGSESTATIDGTEYAVGAIERAGGGGGGHGGGGGEGELEASITWTNESGLHTADIAAGDVIDYQGTDHEVVVGNESNVSSATLQEYFNVTAILAQDDAVEDELATYNDTDHVVYEDNGSIQPLSEYLPEPNTVELETGDTLQYQGNETTVREITSDGMTVGWIAPLQMEQELSEGGNITLANDEQYFAHFPTEDRVIVAPMSEYDQYANTVDQQTYFGERLAGLWGIVIICGIAALFLLSVAYMPVRG